MADYDITKLPGYVGQGSFDTLETAGIAPRQQVQSSGLGAVGRGAIRGATPAAVGLAAGIPGAEAGLALGGPIGAVIGGMVTGLPAAYAAGWGQQKIFESSPGFAAAIGQSPEQQQADVQQHPLASMAGELAPNLLAFRPSLSAFGSTAGKSAEAVSAINTARVNGAVNALVGGGMEAGQEVASGEPVDLTRVALATAMGGLGQKETALGSRIAGIGRSLLPESMRGGAVVADEPPASAPSQLLALPAPPRDLVPVGQVTSGEPRQNPYTWVQNPDGSWSQVIQAGGYVPPGLPAPERLALPAPESHVIYGEAPPDATQGSTTSGPVSDVTSLLNNAQGTQNVPRLTQLPPNPLYPAPQSGEQMRLPMAQPDQPDIPAYRGSDYQQPTTPMGAAQQSAEPTPTTQEGPAQTSTQRDMLNERPTATVVTDFNLPSILRTIRSQFAGEGGALPHPTSDMIKSAKEVYDFLGRYSHDELQNYMAELERQEKYLETASLKPETIEKRLKLLEGKRRVVSDFLDRMEDAHRQETGIAAEDARGKARPGEAFDNTPADTGATEQQMRERNARETATETRKDVEAATRFTDEVVQGAQNQREAAKRDGILQDVLANEDTRNPEERFKAALRSRGIRDLNLTEAEQAKIQRWKDVHEATNEPYQNELFSNQEAPAGKNPEGLPLEPAEETEPKKQGKQGEMLSPSGQPTAQARGESRQQLIDEANRVLAEVKGKRSRDIAQQSVNAFLNGDADITTVRRVKELLDARKYAEAERAANGEAKGPGAPAEPVEKPAVPKKRITPKNTVEEAPEPNAEVEAKRSNVRSLVDEAESKGVIDKGLAATLRGELAKDNPNFEMVQGTVAENARRSSTGEKKSPEVAPETDEAKAAREQAEIDDYLSRRKETYYTDRNEPSENEESPRFNRRRRDSETAGSGMPREDVERIAADSIKNWRNKPKVEVVDTVADLPEHMRNVPEDTPALFGEDGKLYLIAKNAGNEAHVRASVYHEGLGHYGLQARFGKALGSILDKAYSNPRVRELADAWLKRNIAKHPEYYKGLDKEALRRLSVEEVLARESEGGAVEAGTAWESVKDLIRKFGRVLGMDVNYSNNEVREILRAAHEHVLRGRGQPVSPLRRLMYTGEKAAHIDSVRNKLARGKILDAAGENVGPDSEFRNETGWFKAADGKWRFEIPDADAKLTPEFTALAQSKVFGDRHEMRLGDALEHPELYRLYPGLENITVIKQPDFMDMFKSTQGWFDHSKGTLNVTPYAVDPIGTMLHEIQHAIQAREDFARGGNPATAISKLPADKVAQLKEATRATLLSKYAEDQGMADLYKQLAKTPEAKTYIKSYQEHSDAWNAYDKNKNDETIKKRWLATLAAKDNARAALRLRAFGERDYFKLTDAQRRMDSHLVTALERPDFATTLSNNVAKARNKLLMLDKLRGDELVKYLGNTEAGFNTYRALFGEVEARDTAARRGMSADERAAAKPYAGEKIPESDYVVHFTDDKSANTFADLPNSPRIPAAKLRSTVNDTAERLFEKMPPAVEGKLRPLWDSLAFLGKRGVTAWSFTPAVIDDAVKAGIRSAADYSRAKLEQARLKMDKQMAVERVLQDFEKLDQSRKGTGAGSLNRFIFDSTTQNKWGFKPEWVKDFNEKLMDNGLVKAFDALPKSEQQIARDVLKYGHDTLREVKSGVLDAFASEYAQNLELGAGKELRKVFDEAMANAKEPEQATLEAFEAVTKAAKGTIHEELIKNMRSDLAADLAKFHKLMRLNESMPYAPKRRFGDYVVVGRSNHFNEMEANLGKGGVKQKDFDELKSNPNHYIVDFASTAGEAAGLRREMAKRFGMENTQWFPKEQAEGRVHGDKDMFMAFQRLNKVMTQHFENLGDKKGLATARSLVSDLYLSMLTENSSRKSELNRMNVPGKEALRDEWGMDMMRNFASKGLADAHFVGNLHKNGEILDAINKMREQASDPTSQNRETRALLVNELMMRHAVTMGSPSMRMANVLNRGTSMWMLAFSPGYYLQNLTQPHMMSIPYMAGRHGYAETWGHFNKAYHDLAPLIKASRLHESLDLSKNIPADVQSVLHELTLRGLIDIGVDTDLGTWASQGNGKLTKHWNNVDRGLRNMVQKTETMNRLATGMAAYRAEMAKTGNKAAALEYAADVIRQTHGNYDAFSAPRFFNHPVGKVMLQFRKFQLIQLGLMGRLAKNSFGSGPEALIARKAMGYLLAHSSVMAGAFGLPGAAAAAWAYNKLFSDKEHPQDAELDLRRAIGDEQLAQLLLHGAPNAIHLNLGDRLGMGNVLSLFPYTDINKVDKATYQNVMMSAAGPFIGGMLPRAITAYDTMMKGDYYKGVEQLLPNGLPQGLMKAGRYATEGVTQSNDRVLVQPDQVSDIEKFYTALGLPTDHLSNVQWARHVQQEFNDFYKTRADNIKRTFLRAQSDNDQELRKQAQDDWMRLQKARMEQGLRQEPLAELFKASADKRKAERNTKDGIPFTNKNRVFTTELARLTGGESAAEGRIQ